MQKKDALDYEISNSWFAQYITNKNPLSNLTAKYYSYKVNRKWAKYQKFLKLREILKKVQPQLNKFFK